MLFPRLLIFLSKIGPFFIQFFSTNVFVVEQIETQQKQAIHSIIQKRSYVPIFSFVFYRFFLITFILSHDSVYLAYFGTKI
jgi:hypothetical protein